MKSYIAFFVGFVSLLLVMLFMYFSVEGEDLYALAILFFAFAAATPALILAFWNAVYLYFIRNLRNKFLMILLSLLPAVVMSLLSGIKNPRLKMIDFDFIFVSKAAVVAFGFTNLLWLLKQLRTKNEP